MYKFEDEDIAADIEEQAKAGIKVSFVVDATENTGKNSCKFFLLFFVFMSGCVCMVVSVCLNICMGVRFVFVLK